MGRLGGTWPAPGMGFGGQRHWIEGAHPYAEPGTGGHRMGIPQHALGAPAATGDTVGGTTPPH